LTINRQDDDDWDHDDDDDDLLILRELYSGDAGVPQYKHKEDSPTVGPGKDGDRYVTMARNGFQERMRANGDSDLQHFTRRYREIDAKKRCERRCLSAYEVDTDFTQGVRRATESGCRLQRCVRWPN
jgi:hypothetical protein